MTVLSERHDDVVVIDLNSPPHNFMDAAMMSEIIAILAEPCRAAVIAATGKSFCAGANFSSGGLLGNETRTAVGFREGVGEFYREAAKLFDVTVPLVAAVHGPAVGAGAGLALACDLRVSSPQAFIATNFVRLGIHPGFAITETLPALIGPARASDMLLTGRRIGGEEAMAWGLVDRLVDADDVRSVAIELASQVAAAAPLAVAATRATLRVGLGERVRKALEHELEEQARLAESEDSKEGIAALLEKREPKFSGS
ncbi:MAG: hypothetical protein DCC49_10830 [Acidobacteria bacterium]|nr:MAG: hypothetical protein DCC49_10830 [Acidobacteriota bacterium]